MIALRAGFVKKNEELSLRSILAFISFVCPPHKTPRNRAVSRRFFYDYNVYKATEGFSANTSFIRYCSFRKKISSQAPKHMTAM